MTKTCQKSSWYRYVFTLVCCFSVCLSRGLFCFLRFLPELVSFPFLVLFSVSSPYLTFLPVVLTVIFLKIFILWISWKCSWATLQVVKTKFVEKTWHDNRASLLYAVGLWCSCKYSYGFSAFILSLCPPTRHHFFFFLSIHLYLSVSISFHIPPLSFIKMQTHAL